MHIKNIINLISVVKQIISRCKITLLMQELYLNVKTKGFLKEGQSLKIHMEKHEPVEIHATVPPKIISKVNFLKAKTKKRKR